MSLSVLLLLYFFFSVLPGRGRTKRIWEWPVFEKDSSVLGQLLLLSSRVEQFVAELTSFPGVSWFTVVKRQVFESLLLRGFLLWQIKPATNSRVAPALLQLPITLRSKWREEDRGPWSGKSWWEPGGIPALHGLFASKRKRFFPRY